MIDENNLIPRKNITETSLLEICDTLKLLSKFSEFEIKNLFCSMDYEGLGEIPFEKFVTRIAELSSKKENSKNNELFVSLIKYFLTPSSRISDIIRRAIAKLNLVVKSDNLIMKEMEWVLSTLSNKNLFDFEIKDDFFDSDVKDNYILSFISEYSSNAGTRKPRNNFGSTKSPNILMARKSKSLDFDLDFISLKEYSEKDYKISNNIKDIDNPNFDIFEFEKIVGYEKSMKIIVRYILECTDVYFHINKNKFDNFITKTRSHYKNNPYHNETHAKDVLQTVYTFIRVGNIDKIIDLNEIDILSMLIASLLHDLNHPGLNNNYQINSLSKLALRYSDKSVLENHHIYESFKLINQEESSILDQIPSDDFRIFRKRFIESILATDMANHAKISTNIKLRLESFNPSEDDLKNVLLGENLNQKFERQQDVLNFLVHSSDISNPTKPFNVYKNWVNRVTEEFFAQGDLEKEQNLPISFLCDRNTTNIPKSQIGFMNNIVSPLFKSISLLFPQLKVYEETINENVKIYQKME